MPSCRAFGRASTRARRASTTWIRCRLGPARLRERCARWRWCRSRCRPGRALGTPGARDPSSCAPWPRQLRWIDSAHAPKMRRSAGRGAAATSASVVNPIACSFCSATGPMPGNFRTGSGPRKAGSRARRDEQHAARLGETARHFGDGAAGGDAGARRQARRVLRFRRSACGRRARW